MCLAIPMKIKRIAGNLAQVEAGRFLRTINIQMLSQPKTGDYVMVHAGFAIEKLDPQRAKETLELIHEPRPSYKGRGSERKEERGEIH